MLALFADVHSNLEALEACLEHVLGAPAPQEKMLGWWRSVASGVTANAHCSVHLVRVRD